MPLNPAIDPEHLTPTDDQGAQPWVSTVAAPSLPAMFTGEPFATPVSVGGGPVDATPLDHADGVGVGAGLTLEQSQALSGSLHAQDRGAVAAHAYHPSVDRDGTPRIEISADGIGDGDSPQTLALKRTGTDVDPLARRGKRMKRWYDRKIDMHRFDVEFRPRYVKSATPGGSTDMRPSDDAFVAPLVRETPTSWAPPAPPVDHFSGLPSWGL